MARVSLYFLALLGLLCVSALSCQSENYIAISFNPYTGRYGLASDSGGASAAYSYAYQDCTDYGQLDSSDPNAGYCEPLLYSQGQCAALARADLPNNDGYVAGVGVGTAQADAEAVALTHCNCVISIESTCTIVASQC